MQRVRNEIPPREMKNAVLKEWKMCKGGMKNAIGQE